MNFLIKNFFFFSSFVPRKLSWSSGGSNDEFDISGKTFDYVRNHNAENVWETCTDFGNGI